MSDNEKPKEKEKEPSHFYSKNEKNVPEQSGVDLTEIDPKNFLDYRFVEYQLHSIIPSSYNFEIEKIHDVRNAQILQEQMEKIWSSEWTYAWYSLDPESYPAIIGTLKTKGFSYKSSIFYTGSLFDSSKPLSHSAHRLYLLCIISIGHSLIVKKEKDKEYFTPKKPPEYYQSYKWKNEDNSRDTLNNFSNTYFCYSFIQNMMDSNVHPLFLVKLKNQDELKKKSTSLFGEGSSSERGDKQKDLGDGLQITNRENESKIYCFKCSKLAEYFCKNCEAYYDETCKNSNHPNTAIPHDFIKIKFKQKSGSCSVHIGSEAEYFCVTCDRPICSTCKVVVNGRPEPPHSTHMVMDIYDAFEKRESDTIKADLVINRAKTQLRRVKDTIRALLEKQVLIEREIDREFRNENDEIQNLTKGAKLKNFSVIAELSEMKNHLNRMDNYFSLRKKTMEDACLKPEAIWINDNYEEVITDIYRNFDKIRVDDYQVSIEMFDKIKETSLKITKKLRKNLLKEALGLPDLLDKASFLLYDSSFQQTKNIVTLHDKKKKLLDKKEEEEQKNKRQRYNPMDPANYPSRETRVENSYINSKYEMYNRVKNDVLKSLSFANDEKNKIKE
ncbi:MAG: B-box zinc finger protein, partial [archaeon]|nr:B-box zinc finger protein [archaeon]